VGGDISIPNNIGTLTGTNAHILITLGIYSPVSLEIADSTIETALLSLSKSIFESRRGFTDKISSSFFV